MAGWQFPFLLPLLALPTALLAMLWLKNPEPKKSQDFSSYLKNTWKNINRKTVWGIFIINVLLFFILYGAFLSFFPQLMKERFNASAFYIGAIMSGFSIITAITASQKKHINRHLGVKPQIYISLVLYMVTMLLISASHQWWQLFFPLVAFGLAQGMLMPEVQTLLVGFAPLNERAGFMSINSMVLRLGQSVGPIFIGLFYALGGVGTAFIGGATVAVVMLLVAFFMVKV
jgi:predicted MFS family arabinose efflux permease